MSLNVTLPEPLESYVESQIAQGIHVSVNEYFQSLVRQDQAALDRQELSGEASSVKGCTTMAGKGV